MSLYENSADADAGSKIAEKHLEMRLANRIKFDAWDGNPRQCKSCGRGIETVRLKLLNATQCSKCVQQKDWYEDD